MFENGSTFTRILSYRQTAALGKPPPLQSVENIRGISQKPHHPCGKKSTLFFEGFPHPLESLLDENVFSSLPVTTYCNPGSLTLSVKLVLTVHGDVQMESWDQPSYNSASASGRKFGWTLIHLLSVVGSLGRKWLKFKSETEDSFKNFELLCCVQFFLTIL